MVKDYWLSFGSGDPRNTTGLTPTFIIFQTTGGTTLVSPLITEPGSSTGLYSFQYGPTLSIVFTVDGGAGLSNGDRYISGALDPIQAVDQGVGYVTDSFGSTAIDPSTLFGYVKRLQEWLEGNAEFLKSVGLWSVYSRGSSTLLRQKTLTNTPSEANKD